MALMPLDALRLNTQASLLTDLLKVGQTKDPLVITADFAAISAAAQFITAADNQPSLPRDRSRIVSTALAADPDGSTVALRRRGSAFEMVVGTVSARAETAVPLTREQFEALWAVTAAGRTVAAKAGDAAAPKEIENKYRVALPLAQIPVDLSKVKSKALQQGYLVVEVSAPNTTVRLRDKGGKKIMTVKQGTGASRTEVEFQLSQEVFAALWPMTTRRTDGQARDMRVIEKTRYEIPYNGNTIELDVYGGALQGFLSAEVEFEDAAAQKRFDDNRPGWFGTDVTTDERYKNHNLARYGLPKD